MQHQMIGLPQCSIYGAALDNDLVTSQTEHYMQALAVLKKTSYLLTDRWWVLAVLLLLLLL
jgi:hypothetical protein